jgi:hypothetical protein
MIELDKLFKTLEKKKIKTFDNISLKLQEKLLDEYAVYWAAPDKDITDKSLEGEYSKLSFDSFCKLFHFEDNLDDEEKLLEYEEYITAMTENPWNYWSPIDPKNKGDIAGIAPGGFLIKKM